MGSGAGLEGGWIGSKQVPNNSKQVFEQFQTSCFPEISQTIAKFPIYGPDFRYISEIGAVYRKFGNCLGNLRKTTCLKLFENLFGIVRNLF